MHVVIAGSPCKAFTPRSGDQSGLARADARLFILQVMKWGYSGWLPWYFILEQVIEVGILHGGAALQLLLQELESLGYVVQVWDLDALDFGGRSRRRRLYIVAVLREIYEVIGPLSQPREVPRDRSKQNVADIMIPFAERRIARANVYDISHFQKAQQHPEDPDRVDIEKKYELGGKYAGDRNFKCYDPRQPAPTQLGGLPLPDGAKLNPSALFLQEHQGTMYAASLVDTEVLQLLGFPPDAPHTGRRSIGDSMHCRVLEAVGSSVYSHAQRWREYLRSGGTTTPECQVFANVAALSAAHSARVPEDGTVRALNDLGCSHCLFSDTRFIQDPRPCNIPIRIASGSCIYATQYGKARWCCVTRAGAKKLCGVRIALVCKSIPQWLLASLQFGQEMRLKLSLDPIEPQRSCFHPRDTTDRDPESLPFSTEGTLCYLQLHPTHEAHAAALPDTPLMDSTPAEATSRARQDPALSSTLNPDHHDSSTAYWTLPPVVAGSDAPPLPGSPGGVTETEGPITALSSDAVARPADDAQTQESDDGHHVPSWVSDGMGVVERPDVLGDKSVDRAPKPLPQLVARTGGSPASVVDCSKVVPGLGIHGAKSLGHHDESMHRHYMSLSKLRRRSASKVSRFLKQVVTRGHFSLDYVGPVAIPTIDGATGIHEIHDLATGYGAGLLVSSKGNVAHVLKSFCIKHVYPHIRAMLTLQADCALEYGWGPKGSSDVRTFCTQAEIDLQHTAKYDKNMLEVERFHKTHTELQLYFMVQGGAPEVMWGWARLAAIEVFMCTVRPRATEFMGRPASPRHAFTGWPEDAGHLRAMFCLVYVLADAGNTSMRHLNTTGIAGVHVGYGHSEGMRYYKVFIPSENRIRCTANVHHHEQRFPMANGELIYHKGTFSWRYPLYKQPSGYGLRLPFRTNPYAPVSALMPHRRSDLRLRPFEQFLGHHDKERATENPLAQPSPLVAQQPRLSSVSTTLREGSPVPESGGWGDDVPVALRTRSRGATAGSQPVSVTEATQPLTNRGVGYIDRLAQANASVMFQHLDQGMRSESGDRWAAYSNGGRPTTVADALRDGAWRHDLCRDLAAGRMLLTNASHAQAFAADVSAASLSYLEMAEPFAPAYHGTGDDSALMAHDAGMLSSPRVWREAAASTLVHGPSQSFLDTLFPHSMCIAVAAHVACALDSLGTAPSAYPQADQDAVPVAVSDGMAACGGIATQWSPDVGAQLHRPEDHVVPDSDTFCPSEEDPQAIECFASACAAYSGSREEQPDGQEDECSFEAGLMGEAMSAICTDVAETRDFRPPGSTPLSECPLRPQADAPPASRECANSACFCIAGGDDLSSRPPAKAARIAARARRGQLDQQDHSALYELGDSESAHAFVSSVEHAIGGATSTPCTVRCGGGLPTCAKAYHAAAAGVDYAASHYTPKTLKKAMQADEWDKCWAPALVKEMSTLCGKGTWRVVKKAAIPPRAQICRSQTVQKIKEDDSGGVLKYKIRLCADGRLQEEGDTYDDTFASVCRIETFRMFMAEALRQDMEVKQMDYEAAFVQADINTKNLHLRLPAEIYEAAAALGYPDGLRKDQIGEPGDAVVLDKSLYGIRQAANLFDGLKRSHLEQVGFRSSSVDESLYVIEDGDFKMYLISWVDDCLYASSDPKRAEEILDKLASLGAQFERMGPAKWFLGVKVQQALAEGVTILSQPAYTEAICRTSMHGDVTAASPVSTPCSSNRDIDHSACPMLEGLKASEKKALLAKQSAFRKDVGKLQYLTRLTRPDICFAVNRLARFAINSGAKHWDELLHLLRYVNCTKELGIAYHRDHTPNFLVTSNAINMGTDVEHMLWLPVAWGDADHAGEATSRVSNSGFCVTYMGAALAYGSEKQTCIALSTCEAELVAMARVVQEVVFLRKLLQEFRTDGLAQPTFVFCDNKGALELVKNNVHHKRTKHIDLRYFYTRHAEKEGEVITASTPTECNLSDGMTKGVDRDTILDHRFDIHGMDITHDVPPVVVLHRVANPSTKIGR